jgi:AcrR family transcriptional regulator
VTPRRPQPAPATTRERLLDAAVAFVRERGVLGWSLRELATACGTSHTHLLYHFGSREQLLVDVMLEIRRRDRSDFAAETVASSAARYLQDGFAFLADKGRINDMRIFFYVTGLALQDPAMERFFDDIVFGNVDVVGEDAGERLRRRVALAAMRGLLLDLLATGDRSGVEAAVRELAEMLDRR